jgi:MFS family permease
MGHRHPDGRVFRQGFASITWVLVSLIAPRRLLSLTGGVFNFFGNLSAIFVPLLVGFIVKRSGYAPALALVAAPALGGLCRMSSSSGARRESRWPTRDRAADRARVATLLPPRFRAAASIRGWLRNRSRPRSGAPAEELSRPRRPAPILHGLTLA